MREVSPRRTRPARLAALALLPMFADLKDRRVVVAGDGAAALWKAELAAAAGARVAVLAPKPDPDFAALSAAPPAGSVAIFARSWREDDLCGVALAIGALRGADACAFAAAARQRGVPVNIVDRPELSDISFGTIVNRSPAIVAISTAGAAPVLAQCVRAKIEALLPPALGAWAAAAAGVRRVIKARLPLGAARREAWRRFAEKALTARSAPEAADFGALLSAAPASGAVALVGAGPGDPELVTLKALRWLQSADVILYDRLVSEGVLELARREAKRIPVGKAAGGPRCRQEVITRLMVDLARQGQRVVRLKNGDPMVFARAAEELAACREAGIAVEVVPGITAALGAAAELQVPLTHRRDIRRLQFVTGHAERGGAPEHPWASLADRQATTVFYMGARTFAEMLPRLIAGGLDPNTPAIAVSAATTPRARRQGCPVKQLPAVLADFDRSVPTLILIGQTLSLGATDADRSLSTAPPFAGGLQGATLPEAADDG
jgi:uroporphyrin-III C-methyltransferase/precorrin-2 dehydrogenase/sirohydrochlorin ferrochelatase